MTGLSTELLICLSYLLVVLIVGLLPSRQFSNSVPGFVAGDRSLNVLVLYFVMGAAIFSSFAFLGGPGWAYSRGAAAFFILTYGAFGLLPFYFLGPKAWRVGKRFGFVTQAELLGHRFDSRLMSGLLSVITVAALVPYLTIQMTGAGYIFATVSDGLIPEWLGALLTYGVVTIYVLSSGVLGVGWTSMLQGLLMMVIAWFLGLYVPQVLYGGIGPMFEQLLSTGHGELLSPPGLAADGAPWHWWGYSSAVVVSVLGFSCWPHFFMKAFAARGPKSIKLMVVMYPTFQLFIVPILIIGFAGILAMPGLDNPDRILPSMLTELQLSPVLVGLVCLGTLAASMSSGDAILHAAASVLVRDGIGSARGRGMTDGTERRLIRISAVVLGAVAYWFAVVSEMSLVALLLASYGAIAQMFPVLIAAFYSRRVTGAGAVSGLAGGVAASVLFMVFPEWRPLPVHEGVYGLVANVSLMMLVSRGTKRLAPERIAAYVEDRLD